MLHRWPHDTGIAGPKSAGITRLKHTGTTDLKYAGTVTPKPWYCRPHNAGIATPKRGITSLIDKNTGIANLRYTGTVALKTLALQASECYNDWHCWPQEPWHYGLKEYWYTADLIKR